MKSKTAGFLILLFALLTGCDNQGRPLEEAGLDKLAPGVSSESDVRMVMGQPDKVWEEEGLRILQYPKGPEGARTWEFVISADGTLSSFSQVLKQETFARIRPGMSQDEVRRLLGRERTAVKFPRKNEEVWDWRYQDGSQTRLFNVHFDSSTGRVTGTSTSDANND